MNLLKIDRFNEIDKETSSYIIAEDVKGRVVFNLSSPEEQEQIKKLNPEAFKLVMEHPNEVLDCDSLTFTNNYN